MAILLQAYLKFEEYLRDGKSDLTAGRLVAKNFYTRETRANAAQNKNRQSYWYRCLPCQGTYSGLSLLYDNGEIVV
jgi:hypothetical protein